MPYRMSNRPERTVASIGARLKISREALGFSNQAEYCRQAGISKTAYNGWEKCNERPSLDGAYKLKDEFGLTLEWIYDGDHSGIKRELFEAIKALRKVRKA